MLCVLISPIQRILIINDYGWSQLYADVQYLLQLVFIAKKQKNKKTKTKQKNQRYLQYLAFLLHIAYINVDIDQIKN